MGVRFGIVIGLILSFSSCSDTGNEEPGEGYKARSGKKIYTDHCVSCHGDDGKLCTAGAKDLSVSKADSVDIMDILMNGKNGMPRQARFIKTDEEYANLISHLKTLRK